MQIAVIEIVAESMANWRKPEDRSNPVNTEQPPRMSRIPSTKGDSHSGSFHGRVKPFVIYGNVDAGKFLQGTHKGARPLRNRKLNKAGNMSIQDNVDLFL